MSPTIVSVIFYYNGFEYDYFAHPEDEPEVGDIVITSVKFDKDTIPTIAKIVKVKKRSTRATKAYVMLIKQAILQARIELADHYTTRFKE